MRTRDGIDGGSEELSLLYVIGTYPSLTTTFIDREIASLRRMGASVQVIAMRRPLGALSPEQRGLQRGVIYILPAAILPVLTAHTHSIITRPRRYFGTLFFLVTRDHPTLWSRIRTLGHFGAGVYATYLLRGRPCNHVHAHFIDRAATLAMVMSRLLGVRYSVTAHAFDIYVKPVLLPEKVAHAKFVATCSRHNVDHLSRAASQVRGDRGKPLANVTCIYNGLDLSFYSPNGSPHPDLPSILAVAQLKEKKGLVHLVKACRVLREQGYLFECEIVGEGPQRPELEGLVRDLCLEDTVRLPGALPHPEVIRRYERAHVFALPCVLGGDGDRDGMPTVILEAMAMRLPVVSTRILGIPEVVSDGVDGLLVPPADHLALAGALGRLLDDPALRRRLGEKAREKALAEFDTARTTRRLLDEFVA